MSTPPKVAKKDKSASTPPPAFSLGTPNLQDRPKVAPKVASPATPKQKAIPVVASPVPAKDKSSAPAVSLGTPNLQDRPKAAPKAASPVPVKAQVFCLGTSNMQDRPKVAALPKQKAIPVLAPSASPVEKRTRDPDTPRVMT